MLEPDLLSEDFGVELGGEREELALVEKVERVRHLHRSVQSVQ